MAWMDSRYGGKCADCDERVDVGDRIFYHDGKIYCEANGCGKLMEEELAKDQPRSPFGRR